MGGVGKDGRSEGSRLFEGSYVGRPEPGRARGLAIGLLAAALALALLFVGGEYLQRLVRYLDQRVPEGVVPEVSLGEPVRNIVLNTLSEVPLMPERLAAVGLPVYDLRMEAKDWQQLQATARVVTARVIANEVVRDYVAAEFWREGEWTPIEVKLRGLYAPHYLLKRPSLRLKFPADRPFEGKRRINLLDLYDKGLTTDVTTNWELRRYGILTWDSRFAVVRMNGEVLGLYQEIEHFGRSLSDRNGRPEGFILSGRGQLFGKPTPGSDKALAAFEKVKFCHVTPPSPRCDWPFLDEYFDIDRWAWTGAMKLLLQSHHGWVTDNLRVFWDPALGQFEPIPWDYNLYPTDPQQRADGEVLYRSYALAFASAPEYRRLRDQRFWLLATQRVEPMIEQADRLFDELREALALDLRHVTLAEDEALQRRYRELLVENARYLKALFEKRRLTIRWWPADESRHGQRLAIDVANPEKAFAAIHTAIVQREGRREHIVLDPPLVIDGIFQGAPGRALGSVAVRPDDRLVGFGARNEVTGAEFLASEIAFSRASGPPPQIPTAPAAPDLGFVPPGVRVTDDRVVIGPGRVELFRTLEVDASRDVVLAPGLDLRVADGVSLVVHGNLYSVGTPDEPIRVSGAERWGGVLVHGKRTRPSDVHVEHTTFEGGVGGETERIVFTAPFAVHAGKVLLRNARFLAGRAIDAVNFKYADVEVSDLEIRGALDDAFDCDFCRGDVSRLAIRDVGGDALDFSGSDLTLSDNTISGCGDKGISIGENTRARVLRTRIEDCYTGIAIKDLSQADIFDAQLTRLEVGISLYVKKPSFGPSRARVERVSLSDVATRVLRDESCRLEWVDGG